MKIGIARMVDLSVGASFVVVICAAAAALELGGGWWWLLVGTGLIPIVVMDFLVSCVPFGQKGGQ